MRILVIRFSALGDVGLLLPVLVGLVQRYPYLQMEVLTRPRLAMLFEGIGQIKPIPADVDEDYAGLGGLLRLAKDLRLWQYDAVVDLHQNLRSSVLKAIARMLGVPVYSLKKPRAERRRFLRQKAAFALPHTCYLYQQPFRRMGLHAELASPPLVSFDTDTNQLLEAWLQQQGSLPKVGKWVGIAPFAYHETKQWGLDKVEQLLQAMRQQYPQWRIFLFGGGANEVRALRQLQALAPRQIVCVAGQLPLRVEWALMHRLDAMLSMDSANMHLAALAGIPVVSVWGATHPNAGFSALFQPADYVIQQEGLSCRPCSIFGNKPCMRGDKACMAYIGVERVLERLQHVLQSSA